ncbi:hypothetical protein KR009_011472 [Drosophila setifemur]|nr:hypothetical protein KR009_011472 [Drosophila setifemur]
MGIPQKDWLYWCRLCARDDATIKVRNNAADADLVRLISKCFDVEMTLEEPELGSLLCEECYSVILQLNSFSESVNKVQAIFELLRHLEPHEKLDVRALRQEYGLSIALKLEDDEELQPNTYSDQEDEDEPFGDQDDEDEDEEDAPAPSTTPPVTVKTSTSDIEQEEEDFIEEPQTDNFSPTGATAMPQQPLKRKRGRPRTVFNVNGHAKSTTRVKGKSVIYEISKEHLSGNEYACKLCEEPFMSALALRTHKHEMHGGPKKFVCDCCGKRLKTFTSLVEHQLVHTDAKPCVCTICNAAFKNKARLRVHSQTHGEPSFTCNICGKKLQTRAILNKHKYVHMDERRFKCDICGTGCKNSTALKIHLLGHTGLRPYVCKYCGKAFASNTNCRSHKWKKHPDQAALEDESESARVPVPTLEELRAITREMAKSIMEG